MKTKTYSLTSNPYLLPIIFCFFPLIGLSQETIADTIEKTAATDTLQPNPFLETTIATGDDIDRALSRIWELDREDQRGTFRLMEYQPIYIMPVRFTDRPTEQPQSLNLERPIPEHRDYQQIELKFQVSLKTKILQDAFAKGDVWVAFTQQAHWQMYNGGLSRPFRELNYEPELIFTYPTNFSAGSLKLKMLGLSVNHQSNGKEAAHSRSWNRFILIALGKWERVTFNFQLWKRFTETSMEDDNPQIEDYIGRCRLMTIIPVGKNVLSINLRNNLNFKHNRAHIEASWVMPISRDLRLILQASHGYGDSFIDYNYKQTVVGVGFTLIDL